MPQHTVPAMSSARRARDNPLTRSVAGLIGGCTLLVLVLVCLGSLPYTLGPADESPNAPARYKAGSLASALLPPWWAPRDDAEREAVERAGAEHAAKALGEDGPPPTPEQIKEAEPRPWLGTDKLGRSVLIRCLAGGGVSIGIGLSAAAISVLIGTLYGALAGYAGGRVDAVMMRIVDILYGLPYVLLVVLLAVAGDAWIDGYVSQRPARDREMRAQAQAYLETTGQAITAARIRDVLETPSPQRDEWESNAVRSFPPREISEGRRTFYGVVILLVAIGGVSWLTMARVIRGQVLSLRQQPFMEAARAMGVPVRWQFMRHLLPNLLGPIIVYATLTVPQAILQESFLSFLGIGVQPPLPSWGNLAAEGLGELNPVKIRWWLILFPCLLLGLTLLALNFVGEGLREAFDPKRAKK